MSNELVKAGRGCDMLIAQCEELIGRYFVDGFPSAENAKQCFDDVNKLRSVLELQNQLDEHKAQVNTLECQMWIMISLLDDKELVGIFSASQRDKARWLRKKTDSEKREILAECSTGTSLSQIKARETRAANKERAASEYNRVNEVFLSEIDSEGRTNVNVSRYLALFNRSKVTPDPKQVDANVNSVRGKLLRRGASAIGNEEGDYALPGVCNREEIASMVSNKLRSMYADAVSIASLCKESGYGAPQAGITKICAVLQSAVG